MRFSAPSFRSTVPYESLKIPCGHCIGCRKTRAREWAFRCTLELTQHRQACWCTLTYDDLHLPPTLVKSHLSGYLKRLRARCPDSTIRFFATGEYGEKKGRPHYHCILYGLPRNETHIRAAWTNGNVRVDPLTPASIAYVAGYSSKKLGRPLSPLGEQVDPTTGEVFTHVEPFLLMSRRPGIGGHARQHPHSWREYAIHQGQKIPVPRFLHNAWKDQATREQIQKLKEHKQQNINPQNHTWDRLKAGECIATKQQSMKKEVRKL